MEPSPVFLKLFPVTPGSQTPQVRIPRGQYGYPIPLALRPYAGPPQGIPLPDALSMLMLRSNHAAHVNRTAHSSNKSSRNFGVHAVHPQICNGALSSDLRPYQEEVRKPKRSQQNNKGGDHRQTTGATMSSVAATAPIIPAKTVVSSTKAPGGGTIVSSCDENGQFHVRVEYDRDEMLHFSQSPYAVLPPVCLKNIVINTPEIVSPFPQRHGVDLSPSCEMKK